MVNLNNTNGHLKLASAAPPDTNSTSAHLRNRTTANGPLSVAVIFGTRPELIKLWPVIERLKADASFRPIVISTSQHREMIDDLLELFAVRLDYDLNIIQPKQSLAEITTRCLTGIEPILQQHQPDLVLVQGDTTTALTGALAAFYRRIPVAHVEAGLRSFDKDQPFPEEMNRRLISSLAELHFAPTAQNADNLLREGIADSNVFVTGNTVIDSLLEIAKRPANLMPYLPAQALEAQHLILVTAHRRENHGAALENLCLGLLDLVQARMEVHIVYPVHLNPNVRDTVQRCLSGHERIHLITPVPYAAFVQIMLRSHFIITDSGGIQEEGPALGRPVLVFRNETERPEAVAMGVAKMIGTSRENVVRQASRLLDQPFLYRMMAGGQSPYGDGAAANRIKQALLHYFKEEARPEDFAIRRMNGEARRILGLHATVKSSPLFGESNHNHNSLAA